MSKTVIKVDDLSKQYRLGTVGTGTLASDISRWWQTVRGKEDPFLKIGEENNRTTKGASEFVWALKDLSFEVKQGEVLGVIGRNGAGKSTLLKILSRTTTPTTGSVKVKGRIASLLEVGTGFHPELTGRENIFLNGAILGMNKAEIKSKFDEIVDFAGVERYIDTPVKRYSSGMYVRLAFGVAAHLEPEILIVDEVLAVGDAEFQRKCLGKMKDVSEKDGRTVLFVSHDMSAIRRLCNNVLYLANGKMEDYGPGKDIIEKYLGSSQVDESSYLCAEEVPGKEVYFKEIYFSDEEGKPKADFLIDEEIYLNIRIKWNELQLENTSIIIGFLDFYKRKIFSSLTPVDGEENVRLRIEPKHFTRGRYSLQAIIYKLGVKQYDVLEDVCSFNIIDIGSEFDGLHTFDYGVVFLNSNWLMNEATVEKV
jgi:lipopolysaccharide transport system ATP-binding protein